MIAPQRIKNRPSSLLSFIYTLVGPATVVATLILLGELLGTRLDRPYAVLAVIAFLLSYIVFRELNINGTWYRSTLKSQLRDLLVAWVILVGILLFLGYATKVSDAYSRKLILAWFFIVPPMILLAQRVAAGVLSSLLMSAERGRNAVIVGVNDLARNLEAELSAARELNVSVKGYFDDRSLQRIGLEQRPAMLLGSLATLGDYMKSNRVDLVYITLPMVHEKRILQVMDLLSDTTASIYFVPDLFIFDLIQARIDEIHGIPVLAVCESPFYGMQGLLKRISDIVVALLILIMVFPLLLLIALGIKLTSRGKVLFKQKRYGLDGEEITVYKFRTMKVMEEGAVVRQATRGDPRITRFGAFLRKTSLDELPQFFNVLQGRMSVVGPRPHAVAHNEEYRKLIKGYMMRHKVRPGITGWAQIHGLRGETENVDKMKQRVQYDLEYLRHWSLGLDLVIIMRTVLTLFRDPNAY